MSQRVYGALPALTATFARNCQFGGPLTPLHLVVAPTFERLPSDLQRPLARQFYKRRYGADEWSERYAAQEWFAGEVRQLEQEKLHIAFDETEINHKAKQWAEICQRLGSLKPMQVFAEARGIEPPKESNTRAAVACLARLCCVRWWRRQLRKHYTRRAETHLRSIGLVHRTKQLYASDRAVAWRKERKLRDRAMLQEMQAVSDAGDQLELFSVVERSVSNPALRRAELMTRIRGFEEIATEHGHVAEFVTLTTPSAFHRMHANGTQNERWEGFTPRDGQAWLNKMWARVRAKLKRLSVLFYGFRIAEPHHDGTPHWHLLLFAGKDHAQTIRTVLSGVWLSEYANEPGASKYRSKFVRIDAHKGTAAGYVAKYVSKNIDGFEVGADFEAEGEVDAKETTDRVAAWASAHGIRQFQQLGGVPVTTWRECRRLRDACDVASIEGARSAADDGDWRAFVTVVSAGAINAPRNSGTVTLWKQTTGECSQYFDLKGSEIVGLESGAHRVRTRSKIWRIQRKAPVSSLGPVSITVRKSESMPTREPHASARVVSEFHSRGDPPCLH